MHNTLRRNGKQYDVEYKIIILGESRVGKSSILRRLKTNQFTENTISTVGLDFVDFYHTVDNVRVKLQIWDTAGQERFRTITRSHFRNTKGIIFTFDISNKDSFDMLEYWFQTLEVDGYLDFTTAFLVGNKCDLEEDREMLFDSANNFATRNLIKYFETSAKTGKNIKEMFESLAFELVDANDMAKMERYKRQTNDSFVYSYNLTQEIDLNEIKPVKPKRKLANILFRKHKNKTQAIVAYGGEQISTLSNKSKTNKINDKNQMTLPSKKKSIKIRLHDKHNKLSLNCCKIS